MKYIFELNHPKHYYQFKYVMRILKEHGHEIKVLAREKDVLLDVLKEEFLASITSRCRQKYLELLP